MKHFHRTTAYTRFRGSPSRRSRWRAGLGGIAFALVLVAIGVGAYLFADAPDDPVARPSAAAPTTAAPSERTAALRPLNLPSDEAPHGARMEWWYYSGIVDAPDRRYGFHAAVFVTGAMVRHTVMHASLTDLRTGQRHEGQFRTGGSINTPVKDGFDFRRGDWRMASLPTEHIVQIAFENGPSIALTLADTPPVVAHRAASSGTPGLLDLGPAGISYYYSRPRLAAQGTVSTGGSAQRVTGTVWADHQWGDFDPTELGWNWFALRLSDGSDLMVYALFDRLGRPVTTAGTRTRADGTSSPLGADDVQLEATNRWTSPATRIVYPVNWRIRVPEGMLEVAPFFPNAEFDAGPTTLNVYWEGAVKVSGALTGEGFMELSGHEQRAPPTARTP